jgi:hypothetical protein
MIDQNDAKAIIAFLNRTQVTGAEVEIFINLKQKLIKIAEGDKTPEANEVVK